MHHTLSRHQASRAALIAVASAVLACAAWLWLTPRAGSDATKPTRSVRAPGARLERTAPELRREEPRVRRLLGGSVRSREDQPVARANVCVFNADDACCSSANCTETNAEGRFSLGELGERAGSSLMLLASAPGYLSKLEALSDDASLRITLERGGETVSGTVVDASGGPIPGAVVTLQPHGSEAPTMLVSDAHGAFSGQSAVRELDVLARAEAYSSARLAIRAPASGVTLSLAPAAAIAGKVVDAEHEQPLEDVTVVVVSADAPGDPRTAATDAAGEFRVADLLPGTYQVVARSARWRTDVRSVELEVAVSSDPVVLRARASATLTGSVLVAGEPCDDGSVELRAGGHTEYQAAVNGLVHFEGLSPGKVKALVRCQGALSREDVITVGAEPLLREW